MSARDGAAGGGDGADPLCADSGLPETDAHTATANVAVAATRTRRTLLLRTRTSDLYLVHRTFALTLTFDL
jgi:hypothetical protein